jgi:hypothetical protein
MKHLGKDFLEVTLQLGLAQIIKDDFDCELDPNKISAKNQSPHISEKLSNLESNLKPFNY